MKKISFLLLILFSFIFVQKVEASRDNIWVSTLGTVQYCYSDLCRGTSYLYGIPFNGGVLYEWDAKDLYSSIDSVSISFEKEYYFTYATFVFTLPFVYDISSLNVSVTLRNTRGRQYFACSTDYTSSLGATICQVEEPMSFDAIVIAFHRQYAPAETTFYPGVLRISNIYLNEYDTGTLSQAIINQTQQQHQDSQAQIDAANKNAQQQHEDNQKQLEEQKKQTDFITSDDEPNADISTLGNVQGIFPPGPVDSLLNIPFKFLSIVTSSFGGICKPIETGIWNEVTIQIPCFDSLIYDNIPDWLMVYLDLIPSGFILIIYFKHLYKKIDRASSLETNSDDEWGVL